MGVFGKIIFLLSDITTISFLSTQNTVDTYRVDFNEKKVIAKQCLTDLYGMNSTVDSRYPELGYLEFCETRSVFLNKKYILIAFSKHDLALETFQLRDIEIWLYNESANLFK